MEMDNIIELFDEDDNPVRFEHIMTVQYEGEDYVLLAPVDPTEDMEEDEVLVLRIENDENGEEGSFGGFGDFGDFGGERPDMGSFNPGNMPDMNFGGGERPQRGN